MTTQTHTPTISAADWRAMLAAATDASAFERVLEVPAPTLAAAWEKLRAIIVQCHLTNHGHPATPVAEATADALRAREHDGAWPLLLVLTDLDRLVNTQNRDLEHMAKWMADWPAAEAIGLNLVNSFEASKVSPSVPDMLLTGLDDLLARVEAQAVQPCASIADVGSKARILHTLFQSGTFHRSNIAEVDLDLMKSLVADILAMT